MTAKLNAIPACADHDEIQKITTSYMDKLDQAAKSKEKEITEIK